MIELFGVGVNGAQLVAIGVLLIAIGGALGLFAWHRSAESSPAVVPASDAPRDRAPRRAGQPVPRHELVH